MCREQQKEHFSLPGSFTDIVPLLTAQTYICLKLESWLVIMGLWCWMAPQVYIGLVCLFTDSSLTLTATKFTKLLSAALANCCLHDNSRSNILHLNELPLLSLTQKLSVSHLIRHSDNYSRVWNHFHSTADRLEIRRVPQSKGDDGMVVGGTFQGPTTTSSDWITVCFYATQQHNKDSRQIIKQIFTESCSEHQGSQHVLSM